MTNQPDSVANPYVGPRTFQTAERNRFFGREREARDLLSLVISERLTLFYAQSGAGKSSLVNTRLIPNLAEEGYLVLPVARVSGDPPPGVGSIDNLFVYNVLLRLDQSKGDPGRFAQMTLEHFLANLATDDGERFYYSAGETTNIPGISQDPGNVGEADLEYATPPHVLIIDQFEEILTTHLDRWSERAGFFQQLQAAMTADPLLWVVLVLREDFVAGLDPYAPLLTGNLRARYYMQRMGYAAALEAVQKPAAEVGKRPFAPGVAEDLVENLSLVQSAWVGGVQTSAAAGDSPGAQSAERGGEFPAGQRALLRGEFIEPVQLQVVCYQLWERLQAQDPGIVGEITRADLEQLAGEQGLVAFVNQALADFYEQALYKVLAAPGLNVSERELRDWFSSKLITPDGTRGLVHQGGEAEGTGGLPNAAVRLLADQFLIRGESRAGGVWYELVHDRFVQPILQANREWELAQANPLTTAAHLWLESGRDPQRLLRGRQLEDAQRYAREHPRTLGQEEKEFLEASVRRQAEERYRYQTRLLGCASLLVVVLLVLAGWSFWNARQAAAARVQAELEQALAEAAQATAEAAGAEARQQAEAAETARAEAEAARQEAEQLRIQIRADQLAQTALVADAENQLPQRALLLGVEAMRVLTPPVISAQQSVHTLLGRTGGMGLSGHEGYVRAVAFSPDGAWLASAGGDTTVRLWPVGEAAGEPLVLRGHEDWVRAVAFSPDGAWLASASDDSTVRLWPVGEAAGEPLVLRGHEGYVRAVAFSPDGAWLASAGDDTTVRLWPVGEAAGEPLVLRGHEGDVWAVAFSPDGAWLASASGDSTVRLWPVGEAAGEPLVLRGHEGYVLAVAFSPDGAWLASASRDTTVRLWPVGEAAGEPLVLRGHGGVVNAVAFSPDGAWLASASDDNTVRLWPVGEAAGEPLVLRGHEDWVRAVAFSPDGAWLASAGGETTVRLWPVGEAAGEPLVLRGHGGDVWAVAFSPDGAWLASASDDSTVRLWPVGEAAGEPLVLRGHEGYVNAVAFSPDGAWLASASRDNTVRLWPVGEAAGEPLVLRGHGGVVNAVAFSPDGAWLASASGDTTVRLWVAHTADLLALACRTAGRNLAREEWAQYFGETSYRRTCDQLRLHPSLLAAAAELATSGEITAAVQAYGEALALDPGLGIDPQREANRQYASVVVRQAAELAHSGEITAAVQAYDEALALDPELDIDPQQEANRQYAPTVVRQAAELARRGEITAAVQAYDEALALDPELDIDPQQEANRQYAPTVVSQAAELARSGEITASLAAISQVVRLDPDVAIAANTWNAICWNGSLHGAASSVLDACEAAVAADPEHGGIRNSRGLARALTGDVEGAIADFEFFVAWAQETGRGGNVDWREAWIADLRAGRDPFDEETLARLREE